MKKTIIIAMAILSLTLTACGAYKPDTSWMTKEYKQKEQALLDEFKGKYEAATTDEDKEAYAFETAFRYMNLGQYDNAIKYYEIVLGYNPDHPQSLNNLASMYEDMEKALTYEQKLYNKNATIAEVVSDTIRLLARNKQFADAQGVLDAFAITEEGKKQGEFLSEQMQFLVDERAKAGSEAKK
jgi:tetratricopeptide (TPR) repeat protein